MQKVLFPLTIGVGVVAVVMLFLAGVGYQRGFLELGQAFSLLTYCAVAGIAGTGLAIFYLLAMRPAGLALVFIFTSGVLGLIAFYLPYQQQQKAQLYPAIHDISTDLLNPPEFVAVLPLRANAPNPAQYDGAEVGALQKKAYPDITTRVLAQDSGLVFQAALELIEKRGWRLVAADAVGGHIEATASTRWFGFKDDVVIRLVPGNANSTIVDMRSKSRVGVSDIGKNAERIRAFLGDLISQAD